MRDYGKVSPQFWTGRTGRQIRAKGVEAQIVALYLMTSPGSSMWGIYYLPIPTLAHETGLPLEGASKGLRSLSEVGFAEYDADNEVVWVCEMAAHQVAESLSVKDLRHKAMTKELEKLSYSSVFAGWLARYGAAFNCPKRSPFEAPSKPLRSQEQEQEQEQKQEQKENPPTPASGGVPGGRKPRAPRAKASAQPELPGSSRPSIPSALSAIEAASGGRFVVPRGAAFDDRLIKPLQALITGFPDLAAWSRVGRWLASWDRSDAILSAAWLTKNRDAFAKAEAWESRGGDPLASGVIELPTPSRSAPPPVPRVIGVPVENPASPEAIRAAFDKVRALSATKLSPSADLHDLPGAAHAAR